MASEWGMLFSRENGTKLSFVVCTANWLPWVNVTALPNGKVEINGPMANILSSLATLLNFRYKLVMPPDGQWGVKKDTGEWTGMVGMVQKNTCDIILGPLASTFERSLVVTYTAPPFITYLGILGGSMFEKNTDIFGYFSVFTWQVWATVFACTIFLSLLRVFIDTLLPGPGSLIHCHNDLGRIARRIAMHFFEFLGSLLYESAPQVPIHNSSRIAFGFWWMAVIVLMNTFTGQLKASMLLSDRANTIEDIDTLAARRSVLPMVWKGTAYEALIKNSETPSFKKIWTRIARSNGTQPQSVLYSWESMVAIQRTKKVVISDLPTLRYAISTHCQILLDGEFYVGSQHFFGHTLGMAVSKNFPRDVLVQLNKRIRWLVESELVNRWVSLQYGDLDKCATSSSMSDTKMLALKDLLAVFLFWLILLGISSLFLFMEMAFHACTRRPRRTNRKKSFPKVRNSEKLQGKKSKNTGKRRKSKTYTPKLVKLKPKIRGAIVIKNW